MNRRDTLTTVDPEAFERVWQVVTELGIAERHFNELQANYRTLASTWLLATFAATGFLLAEQDLMIPAARLLLIAGVGIAASAGIILLWILDLRVYHQLLAACFREGMELEQRYPWLPQTRTAMMRRMSARGVIPHVIWFYITGVIITLLIAAAGITIWAWDFGRSSALLAATASLAVIVVTTLSIRLSTADELRTMPTDTHTED